MPLTAFISHPACLLHEMGPAHPERPDRINAIQDGLIQQRLADYLVMKTPEQVTYELLIQVHDPEYVNWIMRHSPVPGDYYVIDDDTAMNHHTLKAAQYAAGSGITAIDGIYNQAFQRAFCAVRPPGHHAEKSRSMGFCIFNNVAIAAHYAKQRYHLKRIAIIDFDVHHGNGTQDIIADDSNVLFCSAYQHPFYPYSDPSTAPQNCRLFPLPAGTGTKAFRQCYEQQILPMIDQFEPELILLSAGFDGHRDEIQAEWILCDDDYRWLTNNIVQIAKRHAKGRIVSFLEGGYSLTALSTAVTAHLRALAELG